MKQAIIIRRIAERIEHDRWRPIGGDEQPRNDQRIRTWNPSLSATKRERERTWLGNWHGNETHWRPAAKGPGGEAQLKQAYAEIEHLQTRIAQNYVEVEKMYDRIEQRRSKLSNPIPNNSTDDDATDAHQDDSKR